MLLMCLCCTAPLFAEEEPVPEPVAGELQTEQQDAVESELAGEEPRSQPSAELPVARIPLQRNLRFTIRPTILGLIPPDSAENYGEGLIRVTSATGRQLELHYEIKEEIEKERGGEQLFELQEAPLELRTEFLTRIRRGDIKIASIASGMRIACPLFWGEGDFSVSDYGLLWIPDGLLAELSSSGGCDWDLQCTANTDATVASQVEALIETHRKLSGAAADEPARLELIEAEGRYIVPVNGAMSQLRAVHARDSLGMAEYWFLNDPDNPLLLKMSFIASPDASPASEGMTRQMLAGTGFAITSINY
jgi:hypothetical protein